MKLPDMATDVDLAVGRFVFDRIRQEEIPRTAIADVLGISLSTLSKKLYGEVTWTATEVVVMSEVLRCEVSELLPVRSRRHQAKLSRTAIKRVPRRATPGDPPFSTAVSAGKRPAARR